MVPRTAKILRRNVTRPYISPPRKNFDIHTHTLQPYLQSINRSSGYVNGFISARPVDRSNVSSFYAVFGICVGLSFICCLVGRVFPSPLSSVFVCVCVFDLSSFNAYDGPPSRASTIFRRTHVLCTASRRGREALSVLVVGKHTYTSWSLSSLPSLPYGHTFLPYRHGINIIFLHV